MMFYSLNNTQEKSNFKEAIFNSLAGDGGLYFSKLFSAKNDNIFFMYSTFLKETPIF